MAETGKLRRALLEGDKKVGVWGTGYIGFSTMVNFAAQGVTCVGTDINPKQVDNINNGRMPVENLEYWIGFDIKPLVDSGQMSATTDYKELLEDAAVAVHLIAIPTEKGGKPWDDALIDVMTKLANHEFAKPPLIIIESTLTPNRTDNVIIPIFEKAGKKVGTDVHIGVAPRRDWFISSEKNLKTLPRIIGGTTPETTELMKESLGIVCDTLLAAPDHKHAEMIKSIENAYRHMGITLANQLTLAYPHIDMTEVLKLVGTKWNIETYQPSFGTGGYCIPLSSQYVLLGAEHPEKLTLLESTVNTDQMQPYLVADSLVERGAKKVGVLGLAYKGDLKVHILSPAIKLVERLKERGAGVKLHDPYYSAKEIEQIVGVPTFEFPGALKEFDSLVIVADHRVYLSTPDRLIKSGLAGCNMILDNTGIWENIDFGPDVEYHVAGDRNWLGKTGK